MTIVLKRLHTDYDGSISLQLELFPLDPPLAVEVLQELHHLLSTGNRRPDPPTAPFQARGAGGE